MPPTSRGASAAIQPGDAITAAARVSGGSVDVPAGELREVAAVALEAGTHPPDCDKPLCDTVGTTVEIVVVPRGA